MVVVVEFGVPLRELGGRLVLRYDAQVGKVSSLRDFGGRDRI